MKTQGVKASDENTKRKRNKAWKSGKNIGKKEKALTNEGINE
jgi:hypothetical protein